MVRVCPGMLASEEVEVGAVVGSCARSSQRRARMQNQHLDSEILLAGKSTFSIFETTCSWGYSPPCRGTAGTPGELLEDIHLTVQECLAVLKVSTEAGFQNRRCFLLFETQTLLHCALTQEPERDGGQDYVCLPYSHFLRTELCQNKQMASSHQDLKIFFYIIYVF